MMYMNQLYWGPGVRRINTWYHHSFTRQLDLFPDKLADLQGAVLKVSTFHFAPCNFFHRAENGTVLLRYGMEIEVVKTVARVLNFTLTFMEPPNGENWGEELENGSWFGLIGQLQRHEADIGLANWFVSWRYLQVVDMTAPYRTEVMIFMALTEPPLPHWQSPAFPFHQWTWLAVLLGLIVSGPCLFLVALASGQCGGERSNLQNLSFAWYYAFGLHFCEAHTTLPRSTSTQIFVLFFWLYTMILTMVYSANLKSFLLVKKRPTVMQTLQDLYESGLEVSAAVELYRYEFAMSSNPYLQRLTEVYRYYDDLEKLFPPLLQGRTVILLPRSYTDYIIKNRFTRRGVSSARIMKEHYQTYNVALGLQRHSPLKSKLSQLMGWIQQSGLVSKFFLDSLRLDASLRDGGGDDIVSGLEDVAEADGVIPLSIDHMQGLFLITGLGWFCSILSFTLERIILSY
ncbi:ionotropic receptor 21a-like isoform X2 [Panulirus ornatus]|uniref:ionotropic receptor 21a-like isoform X2 n=1 Tax=Panulirus ornatus TaxID=150431 RepID=UPI003A8AB69D